MPTKRRTAAVLVVAAALAAATLTWFERPVTAAASGAAELTRSVTLITGDKVILGPTDQSPVKVVRAAGREKIAFSMRRHPTGISVVPADATQLLARGLLDPRLFDVTGLLAQGYGDAGPQRLSVIVEQRARQATPAGAELIRQLPAIGGAALRIRNEGSAFWQSISAGAGTLDAGVAKVWLNARHQVSLDQSTAQIGAPAAWRAGYTGRGVPVAVLDTGIDQSHPDLAGKIVEARNFTAEPDTTDTVGHGTHVAATIASGDAKYRGVAPDSSLLVGKVCDTEGCPEDAIIAAMEWAAAEKRVKVVNMSLGGQDFPGIDPLEEAVARLTAEHDTLFVIAAGNSGAGGDGTLGSPASADAALAVGAVSKQDALAGFSSRGPRPGDSALKPDLTAPGVQIVAARSKDGFLGAPGEVRTAMSGTSMATPHVAGAAAILRQRHPGWSAAQIKAALMGSAKPAEGVSAFAQGAGRLDLGRALEQVVVLDQPSLSFGIQSWPHGDDKPVTRTLTYRNLGSTAVTLDLAVRSAGASLPAEMFSLSAAKLTVPAEGTAAVDVTADTRVASADGLITARVVARSGELAVVAPVGVDKEPESYDLTVNVIGRDGQAASAYELSLISHERWFGKYLYDPSGTIRVRLPRGRYVVDTAVMSGADTDVVVQPALVLDRSRAVTLDARLAKPVGHALANRSARPVAISTGMNVVQGHDVLGTAHLGPEGAVLRTAQVGPDAPRQRVVGFYQGVSAEPAPDGTLTDLPVVYHLGWFTPGRVTTGVRKVRDSELAKVRVRSVAQGAARTAVRDSIAMSTEVPGASAGLGVGLPISLPSDRTELFSTDRVAWQRSFGQNPRDGLVEVIEYAPARQYRRGPGRELWNGGGVYGPSLPGPAHQVGYALQLPDRLQFNVGLFSPSAETSAATKVDRGRTVIRRDGTVICESAVDGQCFAEGNHKGAFRIETEAERSLTDTSTEVSAVWTFSRRTGEPGALPIQVIRFGADLAEDNSTPGNRRLRLPVHVQRNPGASAAGLRSLALEMSIDDGATWQPVRVLGAGPHRTAFIRNPAGGYISLRAKAVDTAGNTASQTIIRAYRVS
ncbi:S8 family serine peptidase [Kribbella sandramycini]|uniref:S8 family serine peptidase n=1 Tax=Kribbella sandramycini TaxID=60450 RepID=A0A7Y4L7K7_9ACTN|nr:S8 family serine peptidase [Kribbella sandramycini]MBB6570242.1 hypothetical protein [Kribbella sandramycini]NOL45839.1 S8 family serine peptidase [Kribbella sandramycini]